MNLDDVVSSYQLLMKEWNSKGPDYIEKCGQLLAKLKVLSKIWFDIFSLQWRNVPHGNACGLQQGGIG